MTEQDKQALIKHFCSRDCGEEFAKECAIMPCHEIELIQEFPTTEADSDTISRAKAIEALGTITMYKGMIPFNTAMERIKRMPSAELSTNLADVGTDCISRQAAIDALERAKQNIRHNMERAIGNAICEILDEVENGIKQLPSAQPEKEIAKRVLWTGWKGCRDTRYKCPNCKKPVKNDDIYCHRCGQKLMFPHISFTDYVPGEKQETIVRWDDE